MRRLWWLAAFVVLVGCAAPGQMCQTTPGLQDGGIGGTGGCVTGIAH